MADTMNDAKLAFEMAFEALDLGKPKAPAVPIAALPVMMSSDQLKKLIDDLFLAIEKRFTDNNRPVLLSVTKILHGILMETSLLEVLFGFLLKKGTIQAIKSDVGVLPSVKT